MRCVVAAIVLGGMTLACAPVSDDGSGSDDVVAPTRKQRTATEGTKSAGGEAPAPGAPAVSFVGRFARGEGGAMTFGWPGSRIVARFTGTEVRVSLDEAAREGGPSELDLGVDGQAPSRLVLTAGEMEYVLAAGLQPGEHVVELYRRTEGQLGTTTFRGFEFPGGELLAPPAPRPRRIEFLGDSNTAAYGVEGAGPNCPFSAATQNFRKGFAARVADALGADAIGLAYSGKGVQRNFVRSDPVVFEQLFTRTVPDSAEPAWDFTQLAPDVVVIMLGPNDYDQPNPDVMEPPVFAEFKAKYAALVALVREKYPGAHVFSVLSPTQSDHYPAGYQARTDQRKAFSEVVAERNASGDAKVHFVEVGPEATNDQRTACDYHPSPALHQLIADQVMAAIQAKTGW